MEGVLLALALAAATAAVPARAAPRQKIAILDVRAVQGVTPGTAQILTAIVAGDTASAGYDVLSQADIVALVGFERQKQMLGCADEASCLAEIGGALGAAYVMSSQVGQIGSRFHLSVQLIDARRAEVIARVSTFSRPTEDALATAAQRAVAEALAAARARSATAGAAPGVAGPRPVYLELRLGLGWSRAPIPSSDALSNFDSPSVALRGGVQLSRDWAVEVGGGWRELRHTLGGTFSYYDAATAQTVALPAEDEVRQIYLGAGGAWSPRALGWVSVGADAGVAQLTARHTVRPPPGTTAPAPSARATWTGIAPRAGLELRLDVPVSAFALGVRAGLDATRAPRRTMTRNPFVSTPEPDAEWMYAGWFTTYLVELAVRSVF